MSFWKPDLSKYHAPRYQAIAEAIRDGIQNGELKPGDKLLPHRQMADELGVTIGTVARGYNLAESWGFVSGEIGRGTIVRHPEMTSSMVSLDLSESFINLGILQPTPTLDPMLRKEAYEETLKIIGQRWRNRSFTGYPPEFGQLPHREAGAKWLARKGVQADTDEVVLTAGAQEGFHLLLSTYAHSGDTILVEKYAHNAIKNLGISLNLKMVGVNIDEQGIIPQALDAAAKQNKTQLLFVTPTYHSPSTGTMCRDRRRAIADVARRNKLFIIENDSFSEFIENAPPPIVTYAPERTAYVASLAYCGSPEIRIGFLKTQKKNIPDLQATKRALSIAISPITAEIATHWIHTGLLDRILQWQIQEIKERARIANEILDGWDFRYSPNGLFIWLNLPRPWRATDFAAAALARKLVVLEAERFIIGRGTAAPHAIRIALTTPHQKAVLEKGLQIIVDLLKGPARANPFL